MRFRVPTLLVLAAAFALLPACAGLTSVGKVVGVVQPPAFALPAVIPPDFRMVVSRRDAAEPTIDYQVEFLRSGKVNYEIIGRVPRRREVTGQFEVTEDQVVSLWKALLAAKFDQLEPRYPAQGDGADKGWGVLKVFVASEGNEKTVETAFQPHRAIDSIRTAAYALIPADVIATARGIAGAGGTPKEFVADTGARRFHRPDCPALKEVSADRRKLCVNPYDALDHGFEPCPDCQPLRTK